MSQTMTDYIKIRNAYVAELKKPSSLRNMWRLFRLERRLNKAIYTL